jgi:signal transduction histidine kinase
MKYIYIVILFIFGCSKSPETQTDIAQHVNKLNEQYLTFQRVDIAKAELFADSILQLSEKNNYTKGIGLGQLNFGLLEQIKSNYNLAISHNEKALAIFINIKNDTLLVKTYAALGTNYWQKSEYDKAMQYQLKALKINERLNLKNEIAVCYNYISMIYQTKYQLKEAEEFANKSFSIIKNEKPNRSHISIYHNLANIFGMQSKYKEALAMDSIGLELCEQLNIEFNKSMFYDNIANCFYYSNEFDKSIEYHKKAITIDSSFKNNKQLGDTHINLGAIYDELKNYSKAEEFYKIGLDLCRKTGFKIGTKNALEQLSKLYFKTNKVNSAYEFLQQSNAVKDSILNEKTEQKIAELQALYDTQKKKEQIAQQELKISKRNVLLVVLLAALVLSFFLFRLFYYRYKFKQEQKLQQELVKEELKRSKAILESEENERQRLARELHDGVGQLLSASKLNLSSLTSNNCTPEEKLRLQQSMDTIDDSIKEIRNISHNMVPDVLLNLGFVRAVQDFISRVNQTNKLKIHFESNGFEESMLDNTGKLMLYRIIQESVNNTIKYAEATQVSIQLSADTTEISLLMEDNGKGFDVYEAKQKGGIGLRNIQLRTDYLKGKLDIESSPKNGTTIIIEIPLY